MTAPSRELLRRTLLALSLLGLLLFGGGLLTSFVSPIALERSAREAIRIEVQRRMDDQIDSLSDARLGQMARKALDKTTADAAHVERELREQVPQRVANAIADFLRADCECRKHLVNWAEESQRQQLASLRQAQDRLTDWIAHAYAHTRDMLLREFRIAAGSNAALFVVMGLLCLWKRQSALQIALVGTVLLGACVLVGWAYLFKQDWLHTLLFGDYLGWGYAACLAGAAGLFADIAFNKGRISVQLLNLFHCPPADAGCGYGAICSA